MNKIEHIIFIESPNKSKAFAEALSSIINRKNFIILTTRGHIYSTKPKTIDLGSCDEIEWVETDNSNQLKKQIKQISIGKNLTIYIATDNDREGEAIGWHISNMLDEQLKCEYTLLRVRCNEIIKSKIIEAVNRAIESKSGINYNLVNAYKCRILIDLLIGINGSKLAWQKLYGCKSIGRVQSISIYKIFENETLIKKFESKNLYNINGIIHTEHNDNKLDIKIDQIHYKNKLVSNSEDKEHIETIVKEIKNSRFKLKNITQEEIKEKDIRHLDTADLGIKCASYFKYSIATTCNICKKLYEGINIQGEIIGLITYPRTSSTLIGNEARQGFINYIINTIGESYIEYGYTSQKGKKINVNLDEAHEAIRVTSLDIDQDTVLDHLNKKEKDIYKLILFHSVAPYIRPPVNLHTKIIIENDNKTIRIVATYKTNIYDGYNKLAKKLNIYKNKIVKPLDIELIKVSNIKVTAETEHKTNKVPERYTEGGLVQKLKDNEIGRPSTYQYIMDTIQKQYITKSSDNKLIMSSISYILCYFITLYMGDIINTNYTKEMENTLDNIASGKVNNTDAIRSFFEEFKKIENKIISIPRVKVLQDIETRFFNDNDSTCPNCHNNKLSIRYFNQVPQICCKCGKYIKLDQFGYKHEKALPKSIKRFHSQKYIKSTKPKSRTSKNKTKYKPVKK